MKRLAPILVCRLGDLGLGLLVCAALATFAGKLFWMFDLVSHFQVYYFLAAALLLIVNALMRRKWPALIALALVAVTTFHLLPYYLPSEQPVGEGEVYTVMLINMNHANQKTAAVQKAIAEADPDLLVLQEVSPRWRYELRDLPSQFSNSHDFPKEGAFGIWVLSKFEGGTFDRQTIGIIDFLQLRYEVAGEPLKVVALHPYPPVGASAWKARNELLSAAVGFASGEGNRLAVGDLNCSPWSPYFRDFIKETNLRDSSLGRGVTNTWFPMPIGIGLPIDHVLVSPEIEVVDRVVGDDLGSDHRAVVVEFRLGAKN